MTDGAAAVEGSIAAAEGGSTALEDDSANMADGIAAVVGGGAAESMAGEGVQDTPHSAAPAYAPGSFRP